MNQHATRRLRWTIGRRRSFVWGQTPFPLSGLPSPTLSTNSTSRLRLGRTGYLPSPWLGDEISSEVAAHYTRRAMEAPGSSYQALQ